MSDGQSSAEIFAEMLKELKKINSKLDTLFESNNKILELFTSSNRSTDSSLNPQIDVMALLTLPSAHRKTVMALYKFKKATAGELSSETGRLRAFESSLANDLVRMGYVKKKRVGHDIYFYIESQGEVEK